MDSLRPRLASGLSVAMLVAAALGTPALTLAKSPSSGGSGDVRTVTNGGTINPATGSFTPSGSHDVYTSEFPAAGQQENGPDAYAGNIVDRSNSQGHHGGAPTTTGKKAKSNPSFMIGLRGPEPLPAALRARWQPVLRRAARPGPVRRQRLRARGRQRRPQRLQHERHVGAAGQHGDQHRRRVPAQREPRRRPQLLLRLHPPAIDRTTGVRGQFVTDPSCIYDSATNRFFMVVLTLEVNPSNGAFTTRQPPRPGGQQDRRPDRVRGTSTASTSPTTAPPATPAAPARASATTRTSAPTPTAST